MNGEVERKTELLVSRLIGYEIKKAEE